MARLNTHRVLAETNEDRSGIFYARRIRREPLKLYLVDQTETHLGECRNDWRVVSLASIAGKTCAGIYASPNALSPLQLSIFTSFETPLTAFYYQVTPTVRVNIGPSGEIFTFKQSDADGLYYPSLLSQDIVDAELQQLTINVEYPLDNEDTSMVYTVGEFGLLIAGRHHVL